MYIDMRAKQDAQEMAETVKGIFRRNADDLVYEFDTRISRPNVISPSTAGSWDMSVGVTIYNVTDAESIFGRHDWQQLGELGIDVDVHDRATTSSIEFYKRFDG